MSTRSELWALYKSLVKPEDRLLKWHNSSKKKMEDELIRLGHYGEPNHDDLDTDSLCNSICESLEYQDSLCESVCESVESLPSFEELLEEYPCDTYEIPKYPKVSYTHVKCKVDCWNISYVPYKSTIQIPKYPKVSYKHIQCKIHTHNKTYTPPDSHLRSNKKKIANYKIPNYSYVASRVTIQ